MAATQFHNFVILNQCHTFLTYLETERLKLWNDKNLKEIQFCDILVYKIFSLKSLTPNCEKLQNLITVKFNTFKLVDTKKIKQNRKKEED